MHETQAFRAEEQTAITQLHQTRLTMSESESLRCPGNITYSIAPHSYSHSQCNSWMRVAYNRQWLRNIARNHSECIIALHGLDMQNVQTEIVCDSNPNRVDWGAMKWKSCAECNIAMINGITCLAMAISLTLFWVVFLCAAAPIHQYFVLCFALTAD